MEPPQASYGLHQKSLTPIFLEPHALVSSSERFCVYRLAVSPAREGWWSLQESYLVDPASSHMLVSKIKPCMSKYKQLYTVKLRTAHYISNNLFDGTLLHG